MKRVHVILDCDTKCEFDDQFAIAYAMARPDVVLEGIVSVQNWQSGENSLMKFHREALKLVRLSGRNTPAFKGSSRRITDESRPERSSGVDFIIEKGRELGKDLTVVGTGPATDIANALLSAPEVMKKVRIIWIGGMLDNALLRKTKSGECNFNGDRTAFEVMTREKRGLIFLPGPGLTDRLIVQCRAMAAALRTAGNPLADYLAHLMDSSPHPHWILWDVAAVAVAVDFGVTARGMVPRCRKTGERMHFETGGPRTMELITDIDEFAILADMKRRLIAKRTRW